MSALSRLHESLIEAGIPIEGVAIGPPVRIDFLPSATSEQRAQAAAIVAAEDTRDRVPRKLPKIIAAIRSLNAAQRNDLITAALAVFIQEHPQAIKRLGISIEGDSIDGE